MTLPLPYWCSADGRHTIYHADCRDVLTGLLPGSVDAVVTDPPYGIGKRLVSGGAGHSFDSLVLSGADQWDIKPPRELFDLLLGCSDAQIIWGGNFFDLPPCQCPLCWDKDRPNQKNVSEWEYAWTSLIGRARLFKYCANGGFVAKETREHPTQKPVAVMKWCLQLLPDARTILDPFLGSGTTSVACVQTGRRSIGIEQNERYCEIAVQRLERTLAQPTLFVQERITDAQESLALL